MGRDVLHRCTKQNATRQESYWTCVHNNRTFDDRKDSIIRNPWIAAKAIRAKRERVLGVF